jgi:uridine phosphorylase
MKSETVRQKESIRHMHDRHEYWANIPHRGLQIGGRPALTQIDPAKVGDFVLITVRDPLCTYDDDPAKQIAKSLEKSELIGQSGMFTSYSGYYKGAHLTVVSGGSGSPEMELILYDYMEHTNAGTFIRVGGSGGIGDSVKPGDVVIASGVVREEAMTKAYIDAGYPAACHFELVMALIQAAEALAAPFHVGITMSVDSDYVGCGRPGVGGYLQPWNIDKPGIYNRAGVLNGDRESAAIVTLSSLFGRRGGSVCSVADNIITGEQFTAGLGHDYAIRIALEGCAVLQQMDTQKVSEGKRYWYPNLAGAGK